jgi:serine phosphatase RsbU (regulator of sigma subunit)
VLVSERESDEVFATVAMVRVHPGRGVARFWLAGHPVPVLVDGEQLLPGPVEATGIALGIVDGAFWAGADVPVGSGTRLVLFTDGLIEGFGGQCPGERLGETGLYAVLAGLLREGREGADLADALLHEVRERNGGDLTDDVAMLVLSWAGWE